VKLWHNRDFVSRLGLLGLAASAPSSACTAGATKTLVRSFVAGYNAGHVTAIDRMWAREPSFQWYSTIAPGARLGSKAYDRATLAAYFRTRVRVHERIVLTELRAGYDPTRNLVNFSGKLVAQRGGPACGRPERLQRGGSLSDDGPGSHRLEHVSTAS
jgi:hypothetical protein